MDFAYMGVDDDDIEYEDKEDEWKTTVVLPRIWLKKWGK